MTDERVRTITWQDPVAAGAAAFELSGLDALRAMLRGELPMPPMGQLMGFEGVEAEQGRVVVAVQAQEWHANWSGVANGGLAATLLDTAMWLALYSLLPAGALCTTLQLSVHYVRPITTNAGRLLAEGRALHRGRSMAVAEASLRDASGKLFAHGTSHSRVQE